MNQHLTDADLATFGSRRLDPGTLLELDRHLAECPECRARLRAQTAASTTYAWLQEEISAAGRGGHLTFEETRTLAEGGQDAEAAAHSQICASCRAEVEDLRAAIKPNTKRTQWYWVAAAAVLLVAGSALVWKTRGGLTAELKDGGGFVALDREGKLQATAALSPADAGIVTQALRTGRLAVPESVFDLNRRREFLLGGGAGSARSFTLREPVGEAVVTRRPHFVWEPADGARDYRVRVYDENFRKVVESPGIVESQWTADRDLDGGHTYSWTVTADIGGREVRAPVPPAPEAKFTVPTLETVEHIDETRRLHPDAHLLLASLYANAGAWKQARAELAELARQNPDSAIVRGLEASLPKQ